jgi:hypothetical protein
LEYRLKLGIVVVGVSANDVDDFAVAIGRLSVIASGLIDHGEAIPAIVDIGVAFEKVARGLLGFVEFAGMDEIDGGVGCRYELVLFLGCGGELVGDFLGNGGPCGDERARGRLVFLEATAFVFLATAAGAGVIAPDLGHLDNFSRRKALPVPSIARRCNVPRAATQLRGRWRVLRFAS